jgi:hypothetical protein
MSALSLTIAKTLAHKESPPVLEGKPHDHDLLEIASDDGVKL